MNRSKKISEGVRVAQVRQLFVAQHPDPAKRTATSGLVFYAWLERHRPELLPQGKHDDPLQYLESDSQRPIPSLTAKNISENAMM